MMFAQPFLPNTSPFLPSLANIQGRNFPESLSSSSFGNAKDAEMLLKLQHELNSRYLQDRMLTPGFFSSPSLFMHQHLHQHMHQHYGAALLDSSTRPTNATATLGGLLNSSAANPLINLFGLPPASLGSSLSGAFQPKSTVIPAPPPPPSINPAAELLLPSSRDHKATSPMMMTKKPGRWCAAHVRVAWEIHIQQQRDKHNKMMDSSGRLIAGQHSDTDTTTLDLKTKNSPSYAGNNFDMLSKLETVYNLSIFGRPLTYLNGSSQHIKNTRPPSLDSVKEAESRYNRVESFLPRPWNGYDSLPTQLDLRTNSRSSSIDLNKERPHTNDKPEKDSPKCDQQKRDPNINETSLNRVVSSGVIEKRSQPHSHHHTEKQKSMPENQRNTVSCSTRTDQSVNKDNRVSKKDDSLSVRRKHRSSDAGPQSHSREDPDSEPRISKELLPSKRSRYESSLTETQSTERQMKEESMSRTTSPVEEPALQDGRHRVWNPFDRDTMKSSTTDNENT